MTATNQDVSVCYSQTEEKKMLDVLRSGKTANISLIHSFKKRSAFEILKGSTKGQSERNTFSYTSVSQSSLWGLTNGPHFLFPPSSLPDWETLSYTLAEGAGSGCQRWKSTGQTPERGDSF